MDTSDLDDFTRADLFTRAYLICALWSSNDDGKPLDSDYSLKDFAPETLEQARQDCHRFQVEAGNRILADVELAGHDFWLTRNHHGAGFWDGDWPEDGDFLTGLASGQICHLHPKTLVAVV